MSRRKNDVDQAAYKLNQLGAKVDLYKTNDSGNGSFVGKMFVKNGYENYSELISRTVKDIEYITPDSSSTYQNSFNDGQQFNLWIAK